MSEMLENPPKKKKKHRKRRRNTVRVEPLSTFPNGEQQAQTSMLEAWFAPDELSGCTPAERYFVRLLHESLLESTAERQWDHCMTMGAKAQRYARGFLDLQYENHNGSEPLLIRFRYALPAYIRSLDHPLCRRIRDKYTSCLLGTARLQLADFRGMEAAEAFLALDDFPVEELLEHSLYALYQRDFVPKYVQAPLEQLIEGDPKDEYPAARLMQRHFVIHVGGTNTGKTYQSIQNLMKAESGVYLAPLRLLACEIQDMLNQNGVPCSLLTGEEEDLVPLARHIASTVEKLNLYEQYALCVIDECQMIADRERGFAWTRAILGCQAEKIHLCTAPEGLRVLLRLITSCGDTFEVHRHQRTTRLETLSEPVPLENVEPGDALIAFSKKAVLEYADKMNAAGHPTSIIYGALPYPARRMQMERFLRHETDLLVATDAIGMGLNLPVRRILFTTDQKFDGRVRRNLRPAEVQQIAGRAGRMGMYDTGYVGSIAESEVITSGMKTRIPSIGKAMLGFSDLVLRVDHDLLEVLKVWNEMPTIEPYQKMDISGYIWIIEKIRERGIELSKAEYLRAASIPFEEKSAELLERFLQYCEAFSWGDVSIQAPELRYDSLDSLELYCKELDLYYSFSRAFGYEMDLEWLHAEKAGTAARINEILITQIRKKGNACRKCLRPLRWDYPYRICERCKRRLYGGAEHEERTEAVDDP